MASGTVFIYMENQNGTATLKMKVNDKVISRLFWWMRTQYGSHWTLIFGKEIYPKKPPDIDGFIKLLKHLKGSRAGHLSNHLWVSPALEKTSSTGFREKIKAEFGV